MARIPVPAFRKEPGDVSRSLAGLALAEREAILDRTASAFFRL